MKGFYKYLFCIIYILDNIFKNSRLYKIGYTSGVVVVVNITNISSLLSSGFFKILLVELKWPVELNEEDEDESIDDTNLI